MKRFATILTILAVSALGGVGTGCKEDPMMRARASHATERADEAEAALKQVLAEKPEDFEARRLMADVHRFRGDYARTETELKKLWEEKQFGDETKEFPPNERAQRDLLENQFNELYMKWADSLEDGTKEPDLYARVLRSGLEWNPKSPTLNRKLVDFHLARAQGAEKEGRKLDAALEYEKILQLRTMPQQRKEAQEKSENLRREAFVDEAQKRFQETLKPELLAAQQWNEEAKKIVVRVEAEVDKKLRDRKEEDLPTAREQANPAIREAIAKMVARVSGLDEAAAARTVVKVDSSDESLKRGKYQVTVAMSVDDVITPAFDTHEKARKAAEKAKDQAEKAAEPAKPAAEEGTEARDAGDEEKAKLE